MKKYIILMLLLMFFVTGCGNKKFDLYQGSQDIKITRKQDIIYEMTIYPILFWMKII